MSLKRVGQLTRAVADAFGDLLGALPERFDHFAGALVDDVVEVAGLFVEGHFEHVGAGGKARIVLFEGRDQLVALVADDAVEGLETGVDDDCDLVEASVELGEVLGARAHQGDAGALGGVVEGATQLDHGGLELAFHRVDLDRDRLVELLG